MPYRKGRPVSFGYRIGLLARLQSQLWTPRVEALGLPYAGIPVMAELYFLGREATQDELVTRLVLDKAAVARTLGKLEECSLISRRINPENRRQKLVSLTEKGRALKNKLYEQLKIMSDSLVEGFSLEEQTLALQLLDRMIANIMRRKDAREYE